MEQIKVEDEVVVETEPDGYEPVGTGRRQPYEEPGIDFVGQIMNLNPWLLAVLAIGLVYAASKIYKVVNEKVEENRSRNPTEKQIQQSIQMAEIRQRQQVCENDKSC